MREPSLRSSRLALAGGLAAILLIGGGGFLLGRTTTERQTVVTAPAQIAAPEPVPVPVPIDVTRGVLHRSELLTLAAAAADAAAAGRPAPPDVAAADGRRFEVRLPFGCGGPASEGSDARMRWRYDPGEGVLRVHVSPMTWTAEDWPTGTPTVDVEAIEGFWITRPWTSSEGCPPANDQSQVVGTESVTLPGQTLAMAQFFAAEEARQGRREGRPFEVSRRIASDAFDATGGFRLRLSGRVGRVPGGGPALCRQPGGPEQRPICVIAVTIDEVSIENPSTDETLATWDIDRQDATRSSSPPGRERGR